MLKEALLGTHQDFTEGDLRRGIVLLAIPMILEMAMESLFGVVDVFFVSRLGPDAVATVGLTESLLTLVFGVAIGLSISTTGVVARRIGEKDPKARPIPPWQAILAWLGFFHRGRRHRHHAGAALLRLMGRNARRRSQRPLHASPCSRGSASIFLLFLINAIFRGAATRPSPCALLWIANGINIVLDPVSHQRLGSFSAPWRTRRRRRYTTGRSIGVLYQLWQLRSGKHRIVVRRQQVRLNLPVLWKLLKVSITGILQFCCCYRQLPGPRSHRIVLWQRGHRRLHHRDSHDHLHDSSALGSQQCRRHAGRPESGRC